MRFVVYMKCPDALSDAIHDAVKESLLPLGLEEVEADSLTKIRAEKLDTICQQWFEYGEYLRVEIDIEANTATVLKRERK